ncbi:hypothetical protein V8E36_000203 [Tilletia maclaganii]
MILKVLPRGLFPKTLSKSIKDLGGAGGGCKPPVDCYVTWGLGILFLSVLFFGSLSLVPSKDLVHSVGHSLSATMYDVEATLWLNVTGFLSYTPASENSVEPPGATHQRSRAQACLLRPSTSTLRLAHTFVPHSSFIPRPGSERLASTSTGRIANGSNLVVLRTLAGAFEAANAGSAQFLCATRRELG